MKLSVRSQSLRSSAGLFSILALVACGQPESEELAQENLPEPIFVTPSDADRTAQANAFVQNNALRDWIRSVNPTDAMGDFVNLSNCNIASSCNAYFNGNSTNYFIASGGCPNTSYSTVIAHGV